MADRQVLITGAAGFMGRSFSRAHHYSGDDILMVDDMSATGSFFPPINAQKQVCDVRNMPSWVWRHRWDVVYHFAAKVGGREKIENDPLFNADSLELDSLIFRWLTGLDKKPLLVYPSSSAVYPIELQERDSRVHLIEEIVNPAYTQWGKPDEMYGFTKLAGEYLAYSAERYGLDTLVMRPFSGYGNEQSMDYPFPSIMQRIVDGDNPITVWGDGEQTRDFIHISDIVEATLAIIESGDVNGYWPVNYGTGIPTSFNEFVDIALKVSGQKASIKHLVEKPAGVMYRVSDPSRMYEYYNPLIDLETGMAMWMEYNMMKDCYYDC